MDNNHDVTKLFADMTSTSLKRFTDGCTSKTINYGSISQDFKLHDVGIMAAPVVDFC